MSGLLFLSEAQMRRIEPYFPLSHSVPRVDDRLILSGIIFVLRNGLRCVMHPENMDRTRQSITGLSAGAGLACSIGFWPNWRPKAASRSN